MTTTQDEGVDRATPVSDVKQSFAWGQLFAGSIISGFAVWNLALKALNLPLSETLVGLSVAYEQVRDFLMLPFDWVQLDLTVSEKDALTVCIILAGSLARVAVQNPMVFWVAVISVLTAAYHLLAGDYPAAPTVLHMRGWILYCLSISMFAAILYPLCFIGFMFILPAVGTKEDKWGVRSVLFNILFTASWGVALLLLNWATS